jgi:hypothetical protein
VADNFAYAAIAETRHELDMAGVYIPFEQMKDMGAAQPGGADERRSGEPDSAVRRVIAEIDRAAGGGASPMDEIVALDVETATNR